MDSVFLLNGCMDGLLLYFTGYLVGAERRLKQILTAAILGGGYAVSAMVFSPGNSIVWLPAQLAAGALLVWVAYGKHLNFFRLFLVFFGLSCALAGIVVALGTLIQSDFYRNGVYLLPVRLDLLIVSSLFCFGGIWLFSGGSLRHSVEGMIFPVECEICGKKISFRALRDTGNTLCDPLTGEAVLVVEGKTLEACWPACVRKMLSDASLEMPEALPEAVRTLESGLHMRLLPYRSVGTAGGFLLACTAEHIRIGEYRAERVSVALSPTPVSEHGEYEALWGGSVI